ncbi:MAG: eukaryotic-like serine/threonine-protein kinase [Pyrinomonadaceae bacterium]|nr:eukaryotic-like serine/threonine-protein kinase [Pyrinomonadaceae bacterium]
MKECPACRRCFPDEVNHCPQDGDATTPSLIGEPILDARYQLERRLGQGGMGVVFQARHIFLKTSHAIKVILPDLVGNDPMLVTRFRQEALAAAAIRHQNIIAVTDFGVVRGTMPFLVMEFVSGQSLQDILAEEKVMSPQRAFEFASAIGAGVGAAHKQNIVHRDLKPLNIMTQTGQPVSEGLKILDFGLAKIKSGELLGSFVQAKTSGMMGSPFYMAPEQWSDDEPDARADIYSLGIILYQMLGGDVPFKGSSIPAIMKKHLTLPPPSFKSVGVDVPARVEEVVRHALEKEISARTPTVEVFIQELREAVAAGGAFTQTVRTTGFVADATLYSPVASTGGSQSQTNANSAFDLMDGTISSAALGAEEQAKLAASRADYDREQKQKERVAREELAREAEEQRKATEAKELRRKEQEAKVLKEQQDREERDRRQHEQMERVERQARELEERLARLATSMPPVPQTAVVDPEATQVHQGAKPNAVTNNSFPGAAAPVVASLPPKALVVPVPPQPKGNSMYLIGAAVLVVLLIGGGTAAFLMMRSKSTGLIVKGNNPTPLPSATVAPEGPGKVDMVEIPGGTFQMGRNDGPPQERPEHAVTVPKFMLDRTEVTNAEYADFINATHYEAPGDWVNGKPLAGQERWPVGNVSAKDAEAFAAWRSQRDNVTYRLPTEDEWEFAARDGGQYKSFPWGDTWEDRRAVVKGASPRPVGSYPEGKNRWGVLDLIGNISEWTASKASVYSGKEIPAANRDWLVIRGGSYASDPNDSQIPISATYRDWFNPTLKHPTFGFRLARSLL